MKFRKDLVFKFYEEVGAVEELKKNKKKIKAAFVSDPIKKISYT